MNRRDMVALLGTAGAMALLKLGTAAQQQQATGATPHSATGQLPAVSPQDALARLKAGNERFANGKSKHADESLALRLQLKSGQRPFATVLGCSDSRVPTELVFDQGFGDLFVVRVAGNVVADDVVGSIAYAALHLKIPLFVVMGHAGCGADGGRERPAQEGEGAGADRGTPEADRPGAEGPRPGAGVPGDARRGGG